MYIKRLKLHNYKRLFLAFINTLELTPEARINILVGANGSGKSSTLRELTPLPANINKDYEDEGYKIIELEHKGKEYNLTSGIIGKNKHSFLVDDVELNPAGTRKVQLQLVKDHFNLTPYIHEVLIGNKGFTTMSIVERKNWFTNISTVDYNYAISMFTKFKQRHRDVVGAIKIAQSELAKTTESTLTTDQEVLYKKEIVILKEILQLTLESKTIISPVDFDIRKLDLVVNKAIELLNSMSNMEFRAVDDMKIHIATTKSEIHRVENDIKNYNDILKDLTFIDDVDTVKELEDTNSKITMLKNKLSTIVKSVYFNIDINSIDKIKNGYGYVYPSLVDKLNEISNYDNDEYTTELYNNSKIKLTSINESIANKTKVLDKLFDIKKSMEHNRDHNEVTCPKCNNIWSIGYSLKDYNANNERIESLVNKIEQLNRDMVKLEEIVKYVDSKLTLINEYIDILSNTSVPELTPILKFIKYNYTVFNEVHVIRDKLFAIKNDLEEWSQYKTVSSEYDNYLKELNVIESKRKIELKHFNTNKDKIENDLHDAIIELNKLKKTYGDAVAYDKKTSMLILLNNELTRLLKLSVADVKNDVSTYKNNSLNESVAVINMEISRLETILNESEFNRRSIKSKKDAIEEHNEIKKAMEIVITGMSPTNGLIGKSITNFLNVFISDMNKIINSVWNYSIEVLPCSITEDADLDYLFRVKVDGRNIIEDVSKTSSSMIEIIDLAFKIVSMKYLGMEDYPLYLDEYAKSFDAHHAIKAYDVIDSLSVSSFNQIFMISHYENVYSRFRDASISVLDPDNILLNKNLIVNKDLKLS